MGNLIVGYGAYGYVHVDIKGKEPDKLWCILLRERWLLL